MRWQPTPDVTPCPRCGASLNRLENREAQQIVPCAWRARWAGVRLVALAAVIYACPACEFIGTRDTVMAESTAPIAS